MKRMSALTLHGSLAMCLGVPGEHSEWPAGSHPKPCPETPAPPPADFFHLIDQSCVTWVSLPKDRLIKQLAFPAPEVEARKKKWGEGSWKASMRQAEWFPRQLTVSMPGGGPRSPDCSRVLPFRENDKKKKKNKGLDIGTWRLGSIMELWLAGCDRGRTVI